MNKTLYIIFVLVFSCLFLPNLVLGQIDVQEDSSSTEKRLINILKAGLASLNQIDGQSERRLIGDVQIQDGNTSIYCDSAIHYITEGRIEAFGNILIQDERQTIYADQMIYDLKSDESRFYGRVLLSEDSSLVLSSEINYFKENDMAIFPKPFQLLKDSSYLYAEKGLYYKEADSAVVYGKVLSVFKDGLLSSDSLIYSNKKSYLRAFGKVYFEDSSKENLLNADSLFVRADSLRSAFGNVHIMQIDSTNIDSTHIYSNQLFLQRFKETDQSYLQEIKAFGNIRQWSPDIAVTSDTMEVNKTNDTLIWRGQPFLWKGNDQLSANRLTLLVENELAKELIAQGGAFNISPDSLSERYNQLKAEQLRLLFDESGDQLKMVKANTKAEAVYQSTDDEEKSDGLIKLASQRIQLNMDQDGNVEDVKSYDEISGSFFEESEDLKQIILEGFDWKIENKPKKPTKQPSSFHLPFTYSPLFGFPTEWKLTDFTKKQWSNYFEFIANETDQLLLVSPNGQ